MKKLRELFGEKVRALRKAKGFTQEQLGEKAELHYTYIGAIERAECNLSMDNIEKVAKGLGVEPVELFSFSSKQKSVSEKGKTFLRLKEVLKQRDEKTLKSVLGIVEDVLELVDRG